MRVLFDHQIFVLQRAGGISRYHVELARALRQMGVGIGIEAPWHRNVHLMDGDLQEAVRGKMLRRWYPGTKHLWLCWGALIARARGTRADVIHETAVSYLPARSSGARVITVHDMIHAYRRLGLPWYEDLNLWLPRRLRGVGAVICVSDHTRQALARYHPDPARQDAVVYHGVDHVDRWGMLSVARTEAMFRECSGPFLLYVGDRRAEYKNFRRILQAYACEPSLRRFRLVTFGGGTPDAAERSLAAQSGIPVWHTYAGGG